MPPLDHWAGATPTAAAVIGREGPVTFAELDRNANRLANALRSLGLVEGDAIALVCSNRPEFAEVLYGCQRGGFRLTPANWHLTADEVAYIVDDSDAKVLIADASIHSAIAAFNLADRCEIGLAIGHGGGPFLDYGTVLESADDSPVTTSPGGTMLYTSGTTGKPKGVYRPAPATGAVSSNIGEYAEDGGDSHLCAGPLYHAAPMFFSLRMPLEMGATVVLMDKWDAEEALRLIDEHRVTHSHMVPTMFRRLLALPAAIQDRYDTTSLKYVIHGAAPCPVADKRAIIDWFGPVVWEYYGATEGMGSFVDSATWLSKPGTVGRPLGEDHVIVGDENGAPLPTGEVGLVYMKATGATRFEYHKDDAKTRSTFKGEYFTLGDVGYLDDDGFLFLTDRSANLIISGGVNIYPAEVDEVLLLHEAVADVATIGVPDDEWGEMVLAVVELNDGSDASDALASALIEHCRKHLASFKCPRRVEFTDELPRSDNGKIYKRKVREQYRTD
ncbi:MAG: AMP-binding protein [Acidimicrobiia bacterium]|nr:AMP-binding protein [Acidimicrobiia bacterium]